MKSVPLPIAEIRQNLSDAVNEVRGGGRVRVMRHGKPVAWLIGPEDRAKLDAPSSKPAGKPVSSRSGKPSSRKPKV